MAPELTFALTLGAALGGWLGRTLVDRLVFRRGDELADEVRSLRAQSQDHRERLSSGVVSFAFLREQQADARKDLVELRTEIRELQHRLAEHLESHP